MKRPWHWRPRYNIRTLLVTMALAAFICWLATRWGETLVAIRADRVLVPLGVGVYTYDHGSLMHDQNGVLPRDFGDADRATWMTKENCLRCHQLEGITRIAFPARADGNSETF